MLFLIFCLSKSCCVFLGPVRDLIMIVDFALQNVLALLAM